MRILFLTHRLPYAPNRGDRIRAFHLLRNMSSWADVDLVSLVHDDEEASHEKDLRPLAASVTTARAPRLRNRLAAAAALPTSRPLTHVLLSAPEIRPAIARATSQHPPDVVLAFCSGMARLALLPELARVPLVHDMVDVDSAKWRALSVATRPPLSWIYRREARTLGHFEAAIARTARLTLITTESERQELLRIAPGSTVEVLQNGVDVETFRRPADLPAARELNVVFTGVMDYEPNAAAASWLATAVWPLVRRAVPAARLQIVGANPTRAIRALADPTRGIEVTGSVPDVRPYLWSAAVAVAPLKTARGVQNKVLEAMASGLPVVVTSTVAAGLPHEALAACQTADSPPAFADAIVGLLKAPSSARPVGDELASLSWTHRLAGLKGLLTAASGQTS